LSPEDLFAGVVAKVASLPLYTRILLTLATTLFVTELVLRRVARGSRLYARWTAGLQAIGAFWTAIILSLVYFLSVALVSLFMKLAGKDPLDRSVEGAPTYWRPHDPNPLGPQAAARHQF
jgi:hypothetical protein